MDKMKKRMKSLVQAIGKGVYEKEHILSLALLAAISGESIFLLGPPGTAKSLVARRLKEVFREKRTFEYLMSRFSTPDEIFGPVSISRLKNEDVYERCTEGYLPEADVVFLDEIWKAGPAIQNALLTAINERIYRNGAQTVQLPMKALIAASNELPKEDEGLEALWDRFLIRVVSDCIKSENTFYKMLRERKQTEITIPDKLCISEEEYREWQQAIEEVQIPDDILGMITCVRQELTKIADEEDVEPLDYYVSDRRWKKIVHLLQTSAFLNGRKEIVYSDMYLLAHTLWNRAEDITLIAEIVHNQFFADLEDRMDDMEKEAGGIRKKVFATDMGDDDSNLRTYNLFYYKLLNFQTGNAYVFISDYKHLTESRYSDGVMYWDEQQKAYIIRRIDTSQPFSTNGDGKSLKKVKLRKSPGCIEVDGKTYYIEKALPTERKIPFDATLVKALTGKVEELKMELDKRTEILVNSDNMFVSQEQRKAVKKLAGTWKKKVEQLEARIAGLASGGTGMKGG